MNKTIDNRVDFVYIFDVQDGNPNGDPDAGNLPRLDAETGMGLVTDVCLKRKVRNYVEIAKEGKAPYSIFIREKGILNNLIDEAHEDATVKAATKDSDKTEAARRYMCANYYDVRAFGAVMSTGKNAGQVRGPIQMTFARSVNPIHVAEHSVTRMAVATPEEAEKQKGGNRTFGRKATVPYGLYVAHGFVSANFADKTGFSNEDLDLFFEALKNMFDHDRSAARGLMAPRALVVFKHDSKLGNCSAQQLFDSVRITKKDGVSVPRSFADYDITVDSAQIPQNVTVERMI